jgi:hypothetical protein
MRLVEVGCDIRTIQELPGHQDVSTTMMYIPMMNWEGKGLTHQSIAADHGGLYCRKGVRPQGSGGSHALCSA